MKPPSRACRTRGSSSDGRVEPRHDLVRGEPEHPLDVHPGSVRCGRNVQLRLIKVPTRGKTRASRHVCWPEFAGLADLGDDGGRRAGLPAGGLHARDQGVRQRLDLVDPDLGRVVGQAQRLTQARQALLAAPHLAGAQDREHEVHPGVARGGRAEDVQAVADLDVLDLAEPAVDVQEEVVELRLVRPLLQAEVVVQLRGLHQRPDLLADRRQLGRVHRRDVGVLVEQLLEPGDVAVGLGPGHRRDEVVDERGVRPALGLRALPRVVDQERVDQRQVAERRVGPARGAHPQRLAGQPLEVAVLAEVHDRVRAEAALALRRGEPAVGGQVVVARGQVGVVVDRDRVLAEAARRLHHQHDVAAAQGGDHDVGAVDEQLTGRRTPVRLDALAEVVGQRVEPAGVGRGRDPDRVARELLLGQPVGVLAAGVDQGVDQRVPVLLGDAGEAGSVLVLNGVPGRGHRPDQGHGAGRRVQTDRVADPGVLGRVRAEHEHDPLVRVRDAPQPGVAHRDPGDAGGALGVGHVDRQPVGVELLERERHGDQPAVELGNGDLGRDVERGEAVVVGRPVGAAAGEAEALQDRDVQRGQFGDVPRLVVAARGRAGGLRAPRGEHGDDHGVRRAQRAQQRGLGLPQRGAEHREGTRAGVLDRGAQGLDVGGVPRELLGAVVEDGDGRAVRVRRRAVENPPARELDGRREALAGEQDGVGEEGVQLREVLRAALREVGVGLGGDPGRHRGQLHHLGVRGLLAAERDDRQAGGEDGVDPLLPVPAAAEDADHDHVGLGEQHGQVGDAVRVGGPPRGAGCARGEQVGVRSGQQEDHRDCSRRDARRMADLPRDPRPRSDPVRGGRPARSAGWTRRGRIDDRGGRGSVLASGSALAPAFRGGAPWPSTGSAPR